MGGSKRKRVLREAYHGKMVDSYLHTYYEDIEDIHRLGIYL